MALGRTTVTALVTVLAVAAAAGGYVVTDQARGGRHHDTTSAGIATAASSPASRSTSSTTRSGTPSDPTPAAVRAATRAPGPVVTPTAGPLPAAAAVSAATRTALASTALGPSVHALVVDAASGRTLLARSATTGAPPASTAKLTTSSAALAALGGQARFTTRAVAGTKRGQVVLIGGGDPTLSAAAPGRRTLYPNAARLSTLAAQIERTLGRPVTSIVIDTSRYRGSALGPGWDADDVPTSYASAIEALVVDGGRPATGGELRSAQPALAAGQALARLLGHPTLPVTVGRAAHGARQLGAVRSAPVLDLVEQALMTSDNVIAEMLGRQVARVEHEPASFAGAAAGVRRALAAIGFHLPATLVDASGLSRRDRLSPVVLAALLRFDAGAAVPSLNQIVSALPVAGWEGTLAARYTQPPSARVAGQVRAKTGTLTGVVTLAGFVRDRSGRLLVFAFLTDRVPANGLLAAEAALDDVVASFGACGCR